MVDSPLHRNVKKGEYTLSTDESSEIRQKAREKRDQAISDNNTITVNILSS